MDGRSETFEAFYRRSWPVVFRAAYLISGDRETARDLAQEAFVRAFEHWRGVSTMERPEAWTYRVVSNLSLSWRRRQRLAREREPQARLGAQLEPGESVPEIVSALRTLPAAQRVVVVMRYYADLSIEETARALRKRPATVRSLAAQGIARLRASFAEQEVHDG